MKNCIGQNVVEFLDTGAPRGERNLWIVTVNGVTIIESYKQTQARGVFDAITRALTAGVTPSGEPRPLHTWPPGDQQ